MTIKERAVGSVMILDIQGRITVEVAGVLRDKALSLLEQGSRLFVLNLQGVAYIDSAGLGELVSNYRVRQAPRRASQSPPPDAARQGRAHDYEALDRVRRLRSRSGRDSKHRRWRWRLTSPIPMLSDTHFRIPNLKVSISSSVAAGIAMRAS